MGEQDSRESQNARAVKWLLGQHGGSVLVVTPQKRFDSEILEHLIAHPDTTHKTWRGFSSGSLANRRVLYAWPDQERLNGLWGVEPDALVVIQWGETETRSWIEAANPVRLLPERTVEVSFQETRKELADPLPNGLEGILEQIAASAAGYDSGLKWNEEDKLKADMMNRPDRWASVTVDQVRAKCRDLKMRPNDVETIAGFLERRKQGRRFNVRRSYREFRFS